MLYLGSNRTVTQDFKTHNSQAEDYAGSHKSNIYLKGSLKVIKIINRFKSYEDSINYNYFLNNQATIKTKNGYNCQTLSGKILALTAEETGGNQIWLEGYYNNQVYILRIAHLDEVLVTPGQIINESTLLGYQGNTGLVLSSKSPNDPTYGTHVHFEVKLNNKYINPRDIALGNIIFNHPEAKKEELPPVLESNVEQKEINDVVTTKPILIFTCLKNGLYAINLKEKEKLYIEK